MTPQQLFGWRRQARQGVEGEVDENGSEFTPVVVEACRLQLDAPNAPAASGGSRMIEIVIGAATVRVPWEIDPVSLTTVLRAVKAAT